MNKTEYKKHDENYNSCQLIKHICLLTLACITVIILSKKIFTINYIPSESMSPTLNVGDIVIGSCLNQEINRYDIIVFHAPNGIRTTVPNEKLIKRVIGLPGDTVEIKSNHIYINGDVIQDDFCNEMETKDATFVVPDNEYFVMGDNRNNSYDSRFWNGIYVKKSDIISVQKVVIYPFGSFGKL